MSKKHYESYIIIDGNLEEAAIEEEITRNENLLKKNDVDIINIDRIGRKKLAYQIKKRSTGYYVCFDITAPAESLKKIERAYVLDENILRHLTILITPITQREKEEHFKNKAILQSKYEEEKLKQESIKAAEEATNEKAKEETKIEAKPVSETI